MCSEAQCSADRSPEVGEEHALAETPDISSRFTSSTSQILMACSRASSEAFWAALVFIRLLSDRLIPLGELAELSAASLAMSAKSFFFFFGVFLADLTGEVMSFPSLSKPPTSPVLPGSSKLSPRRCRRSVSSEMLLLGSYPASIFNIISLPRWIMRWGTSVSCDEQERGFVSLWNYCASHVCRLSLPSPLSASGASSSCIAMRGRPTSSGVPP